MRYYDDCALPRVGENGPFMSPLRWTTWKKSSRAKKVIIEPNSPSPGVCGCLLSRFNGAPVELMQYLARSEAELTLSAGHGRGCRPLCRNAGYDTRKRNLPIRAGRPRHYRKKLGFTYRQLAQSSAWSARQQGKSRAIASVTRKPARYWCWRLFRATRDWARAKRLLQWVADELGKRGFERLWLASSPESVVRSHGFYRHLGWRPTGETDEYGDEILEYFHEG